MENKEKKCFSEEHKEFNAIIYCQECRVYMCNKCENLHSKLFKIHHCYNLDNNIKDIFTGYCKEKNHFEKLDYFCKDHNILCCSSCFIKIKGKERGEHKDCDICFIEDIKDEKKRKLNENIQILENLSKSIDELLAKIKIITDKINSNKEELKMEVQKIFTKIRNVLNDKEDKLLFEIDKHFEDIFLKEDIIKQSEKLPNKIKISIEKGNLIKNELFDDKDQNKLYSFVNDCLDIENNIKQVNLITEKIKKCDNSLDLKIHFFPKEEKEINKFIQTINSFGNISKFPPIDSKIINLDENELIYKWLPNNISSISLIYRMSDDGNSFATFHQKCDNQFPALFIAKSKNKCKFGGYTFIGWNSNSSGYLADNKSFLFSLDKKQKFEIQDNKNTIGCYKDRGVDFHNDCYFYQSNMTECYSNGNYSYLKGKGRVLADNKENTFTVEEVEVFKIILN